MDPLVAKLVLPRPGGLVREVSLEVPQRSGDEGMRVLEAFCMAYGPAPAPDPHFDAVLLDDRVRRAVASKQQPKRAA